MSMIIGPSARVLATLVCVVLLPALVHSQDSQSLSSYRGAEIGSTLASVAALWGLAPIDAKVVHKRPALMHDLDWRPKLSGGGGPDQQDPVREVQFSFYNDQLFRIIVSYQRDRILGLTDADLVEALSAVYGSPATAAVGKPRASETSDYIFDDTVIARWENTDSSVALLRASHSTPVRLVVLSKQLAGLARTAAATAARLDEQEEPQRVADRLKQEADADRLAAEKARSVNRAAFKP